MLGLRVRRIGSPARKAAAAVLAAVLSLPPAAARADKIDEAQAAFFNERDAEALRLLDEVIAEAGDNTGLLATAYFNRGEVNAAMRQTDKAIADFTAALELQPVSEEKALILVMRAEAYNRKNMMPEAIADYGASLTLSPGQIGVLTARGNAHQKAGDKAAALADFEAELSLRPKFNRAIAARARVLGLPIPIDPSVR